MSRQEPSTTWAVLELVGTIGFTIAVPLVGLALAGRWMDKQYGTSPTFLLLGIVCSLVVTSVALAKKIRDLH